MDIILQRTNAVSEWTEGTLEADKAKICDTLENSAALLPDGKYPLVLRKCKQYGRKMILVDSIPAECSQCEQLEEVGPNTTLPRPCPMLKAGNGTHNRKDGSILVGSKAFLGCIVKTQEVFDALYSRVRMAIARGHEVSLTIKTRTI